MGNKYEGMSPDEIEKIKAKKQRDRVKRYRKKMSDDGKAVSRIIVRKEHQDWFEKMAALSREGKLEI